MKKTAISFLIIAGIACMSSCATIFGGSSYTANITLEDGKNAAISYNGQNIGKGSGMVKIPRKDANKIVFTVMEEGCPEQQYRFIDRKFRGWAFVGSLLGLSIAIPGFPLPLPLGVITDVAVGSLYKPNNSHPAIRKWDMNSYSYQLDYETCKVQTVPANTVISIPNNNVLPPATKSKEVKLMELKDLFDSGMISEEEYKESRRAVLAQ